MTIAREIGVALTKFMAIECDQIAACKFGPQTLHTIRGQTYIQLAFVALPPGMWIRYKLAQKWLAIPVIHPILWTWSLLLGMYVFFTVSSAIFTFVWYT